MIKVREAAIEDLPVIIVLMKKNSEPLNEDLAVFFTAKNPNEEYKLFVAEKNGKIIGFSRVHFYRWNKSAYAINLLVDSKYRRKGIGTLLLKTMEGFAKEKGARVLMFDTAIDNIPALNLYFKNGFKICGYNNKLYDDKTALYLAKEL
ncbi:MAG: GNAT family N-acetyltransferase [Candidatus Bathyarchaeota archaeon]|jgi:ribosomal protein S18 acetylase RimI-like enzyme|nr:GNAT family N-acetyltransferase [Candidatus Bathyarchaeota archaeon A05DMB-3]MDH7606205.1 GNAT family N-acetyltransferase [Candidatus Bathyarchaeota archaeon]